MATSKEIPPLPPPLIASTSDDELSIRLPEGPTTTFNVTFVPSLTRSTADILKADLEGHTDPALLRIVVYHRSTKEARHVLRDAGIPFAGADGRMFIRAPGLLVEREEPDRLRAQDEWGIAHGGPTQRNPFSKRSSRVPRWLLLHHESDFFLNELAKAVGLAPSAISRVVRTLEDAALISEVTTGSGRRKHVRLDRPLELLNAWLPQWQKRPVPQRRWDIGAVDADDALDAIQAAADEKSDSFVVSGLAGASRVRRNVEPGDVLVWTTAEEATDLAESLQPVPSRGGLGHIRVAVAPDPWTLGLASHVDGLLIADPVQLWLDCASEGERALEAAEAVAEATGWS